MAIDQDPYRTLGLARGASIDEIKRAYRRLAKIHHPDAAGEKDVPRFLAIQAAYEQLLGGIDDKGMLGRGATAPRRPWQADPDRSDATRRAYGGRARRPASGGTPPPGASSADPSARGDGTGAGPAPGAGADAGQRSRPRQSRAGRRGAGTTGGAGATGGPGTTGGETGTTGSETPPRGPRERKRNKATLGSTSYDGADGPFEPDWRGASWYGTTSGTYWTLNPKEYADPRKHGPEYQARARRATRARTPGAPDPSDHVQAGAPDGDADLDHGAESTSSDRPGSTGATARPTHTTSSWWDSTAGAPGPAPDAHGETAAASASTTRPASPPRPAPPPPDVGRAMSDFGRALTDPTFGGNRGRVIRAILGWLPIAFGVSWLIGEITGCGRFAATCDGAADPFVLLLVVAALAVLLVVPTAGSVAAMGAITLLAAAVVAALILSATGAAADGDSRRSALGAVLLVAWLVGVGIAVARRVRSPSSTMRPVS